jgi:hypothetical protein
VPSEQEVRTRAGWIGVEISKSRTRMPGRPGYGLYRVRTMPRSTRLAEDLDEMWSAYAFTLGVIDAAVRNSIEQGMPAGPMELRLVEAGSAVGTGGGGYAAMHTVPTRWTQQYRGRRDLGADHAAEVVWDAFRSRRAAMTHRCPLSSDGGQCRGTVRIAPEAEVGTCTVCGRESDRAFRAVTTGQRRRLANRRFQAEHKLRRDAGLAVHHARKLSRREPPADDGDAPETAPI